MTGLFDLGYPATEYVTDRPGYRGTSLQEFVRLFPDDEACLLHLFCKRYGLMTACPKCEKPGKWYRIRGTKRYQHPCGFAISPLTGTIFDKTRIPLQLWFYALLHFSNSPAGVATTFLRRHLGLSQKAAYRLADRCRLQMAAIDKNAVVGTTGGYVEVRIEKLTGVRVRDASSRGAPRAVLVGDENSVQATIIGRVRRHVLRAIVHDKLAPATNVVTTCQYTHAVSSEFGQRDASIKLVDAVPGRLPTQPDPLHGFLTYMRSPMRNTYRRVDQRNLWKYLKEIEFRHNRRARSQTLYADLVGTFPSLGQSEIAALCEWSNRMKTARGFRS